MSTQTARTAFVPGWTFGDKFRKARGIANMDQRAFAASLDLTASTVAAYEKGRATPRFRDAVALAKRVQMLTGVDYQWLLDVDGPEGPNSPTADYKPATSVVSSLADFRARKAA